MKRLSIILMVVLFCSLQGHAQFWISFGWNDPIAELPLDGTGNSYDEPSMLPSIIRSFIDTGRRSSVKRVSIIAIGTSPPRRSISCVWSGTGNCSVSFPLRSSVYMCVSSVRHRHASTTGEVGIITRIIRTTVRPVPAIVMKIITGIASGNIRTIDGSTASTTANGIPVSTIVPAMITDSGGRTGMIVLSRIITMAVPTMTMDSGNPTNTIVRTFREAVPVPIITRISTIRTNMTRNVRTGIKTGITIRTKKRTNALTRIVRIVGNVRATGGA